MQGSDRWQVVTRALEIIAATLDLSGLPPESIAGGSNCCRGVNVVVARYVIAMLLRDDCGMSYPEIAAAMGYRCHTTAREHYIAGKDCWAARILVEHVRAKMDLEGGASDADNLV